MKKLLTALAIVLALGACTVTPGGGANPDRGSYGGGGGDGGSGSGSGE